MLSFRFFLKEDILMRCFCSEVIIRRVPEPDIKISRTRLGVLEPKIGRLADAVEKKSQIQWA